MTDATHDFFGSLGRRGYEPLLRQATGVLQVELRNGRTEHWRVAVDRGRVAISRRGGSADCTMRTSRALFDKIAAGEVNALAAFLRGAVQVEGDPELLMHFQRLFPGPGAVPAAAGGGQP
jgi:putative sterol carrier protein